MLIINTIRKTVLGALKPTPQLELTSALFEARIQTEEETKSIKTLVPTWNTQQHLAQLQLSIATLLSNEPTMEELLENDHEISKPTLLELALTNMRTETISHAKRTKK